MVSEINHVKNTVIGDIPIEWDIETLKNFCEHITKGATPTTYGFNWTESGIRFLRSECVKETGVTFEGANFISEDAHQAMKRSVIKGGDLLISITGNIGRACIYPENYPDANINQHIARVRVIKSDLLNPKFLLYYINSERVRNHFYLIKTGLAYPQISLRQVQELEIPVPPKKEQDKIASILTSVDNAIEKTEEIIKKSEVVKQGLMQQLLTKGIGHTKFKQTEFGEIPTEWEPKKLGEISELIMGQSPKGATYNTNGVGSPLLNGPTEFGDVHPTPVQWTTSPTKFCEPNDILVCVRGSSTGRMNISDRSYCIGRGLAAIRAKSNKAVQEFLMIHVERLSSEILAQATGSTFPNIDKTRLSSLPIPLPSLSEQQRIAEIMGTVNSRLQVETEKIRSLTKLKLSLMQVLLTGKVRVNVDEAPEVSV